MKQYTIGVDVDDVTLDFVGILLEVYNSEWGDNLAVDDITDWYLAKFVKPECGKIVFNYFEDPNLYWAINPVENAVAGIKFLKLLGHRIVFITHSSLGASGAKYKKLKELGILDDANDYIEAKDKTLVKFDFLIDDKPKTLLDYKLGVPIVFTRPWNKDIDHKPRVNSWLEIVDLFRMMAKKE